MPPEEGETLWHAPWPPTWELTRLIDASGLWPPAERLSIARGVERPEERDAYETDAFVPRGPWERPPEAALAALVISAPPPTWDLRRTVGIVRVPEQACDGLVRLGLARAPDAAAYQRALEDPRFEAALEETAMGLGEYLLAPDGLEVLGTVTHPAGMRTVTTNGHGTRLRVGLHLDAWDELAPNRFVTNRICLNLGREERAFLYVPLATESIGLKGAGVVRFFDAHRECPVVRVRLAPGEAYIAPTEHVLHDGATNLSRGLDVTLTLRGQFGLKLSGARSGGAPR